MTGFLDQAGWDRRNLHKLFKDDASIGGIELFADHVYSREQYQTPQLTNKSFSAAGSNENAGYAGRFDKNWGYKDANDSRANDGYQILFCLSIAIGHWRVIQDITSLWRHEPATHRTVHSDNWIFA
jgi:hypothetical protein